MRAHTCCFIGHSECYDLSEEWVRNAIEDLINQGVTGFLCGGMGNFDWMCARLTCGLKREHSHVRCDLVIPYLTFRVLEPKYFDSIVYPEGFEKYHFKAAIVARNRYLVDQSAYALCYVMHSWGGAAQTYRRAVKKELQIQNLYDTTSSKHNPMGNTPKYPVW